MFIIYLIYNILNHFYCFVKLCYREHTKVLFLYSYVILLNLPPRRRGDPAFIFKWGNIILLTSI